MIRRLHPLVLFTVISALFLGVALAMATRALGDPTAEPKVVTYATTNAAAVCATLDEYPTVPGVAGLVGAVMKDGFTPYQAGEIIALAVEKRCPNHIQLLEEFSATYTGSTTTT
jgi:Protein of unknown function (DUF732)